MKSSIMKKANMVVMVVVGLVLIAATVLKIHQLLTEPIISKGFWESWEFFLIQIPLELGLGVWLISGLFKKAGWLTAVIAFAGFTVVTLQKGLIGAESCGCFGTVSVNPWITLLAIDSPLLILLLFFRPIGQKLLPPPWPSAKHFWGVAIPTVIFLVAIEPILIFNKPPDSTDEYEVVKPDEWVKQTPPDSNQTTQTQTPQTQTNDIPPVEEWPMLEYIDIADALRSDIAVVMLYRDDCHDCHDAMPLYDEMAREMAANESIRFAFIEIPPYSPQQDDAIPSDTPCLMGKLDSSIEWYNITTPLVVVTDDGSVLNFWEGRAPDLDEILQTVFVDSQ